MNFVFLYLLPKLTSVPWSLRKLSIVWTTETVEFPFALSLYHTPVAFPSIILQPTSCNTFKNTFKESKPNKDKKGSTSTTPLCVSGLVLFSLLPLYLLEALVTQSMSVKFGQIVFILTLNAEAIHLSALGIFPRWMVWVREDPRILLSAHKTKSYPSWYHWLLLCPQVFPEAV